MTRTELEKIKTKIVKMAEIQERWTKLKEIVLASPILSRMLETYFADNQDE